MSSGPALRTARGVRGHIRPGWRRRLPAG
uniref:Uncharacterized protein n=1 Tax=Anguilla anguilla TaxID=7936 RepID=A0A0E9XDZ5_ANGAN